jgi:hypothetical protein
MQVTRRIAAVGGIAGLGVIVAETINQTNWLAFRLQIATVVVPLTVTYLLYEVAVRLTRERIGNREPAAKAGRTLLVITRWAYIILGVIALLSMPLLWWGVIQRLAQQAGGH